MDNTLHKRGYLKKKRKKTKQNVVFISALLNIYFCKQAFVILLHGIFKHTFELRALTFFLLLLPLKSLIDTCYLFHILLFIEKLLYLDTHYKKSREVREKFVSSSYCAVGIIYTFHPYIITSLQFDHQRGGSYIPFICWTLVYICVLIFDRVFNQLSIVVSIRSCWECYSEVVKAISEILDKKRNFNHLLYICFNYQFQQI